MQKLKSRSIALSLVIAVVCFPVYLLTAATAQATVITRTFELNASGFEAGAPVDPVIASFTITFDPMGPVILRSTTGITVNSLNITVDSQIAFGYVPAFSGFPDTLSIAGLENGTLILASGTNDFAARIFDAASAAPDFNFFDYGTKGRPADLFFSTVRSISFTQAVPEPSTLLLFGVGLAGLAGFGRRRRRE